MSDWQYGSAIFVIPMEPPASVTKVGRRFWELRPDEKCARYHVQIGDKWHHPTVTGETRAIILEKAQKGEEYVVSEFPPYNGEGLP